MKSGTPVTIALLIGTGDAWFARQSQVITAEVASVT